MNLIKQIFNRFEEVITVWMFAALIILSFLQVIFRFVLNYSLDWTEELSRYTFIFLVYMAASLAIIKDRHVRVEIIDMLLKPKQRYYLSFFVDVVWMVFSIIIGIEGAGIAMEELTQTSPVLEWSMGVLYMIIPFTFFLMAIRLLQRIITRLSNKEVA